MKTKLFLLCTLLCSVFSFGQITFANLTTTAITETSATVSVTINTCGNRANITLQVAESLSYNPLVVSQDFLGTAAPGTTNFTITGLTPDTDYVWRFYGNLRSGGGAGCNSAIRYSNDVSFRTLTSTVPPLIAEYTFNNTLNNTAGNSPFVFNNMTYETDRNGNTQSSLRINGSGTYTNITNLPVATSTRSVSIWYKVASLGSSDNCLFVYGNTGGQSSYGVLFNALDGWSHFSWSTSTPFTNPSNDGLWHHLVTTFDNTKTTRVYIDGVLKTTLLQSGWNTYSGANAFWLGGLFQYNTKAFNGFVDDLKIYKYALSPAEVENLFNYNSLTSQDFNQNNLEVSLYPNPANNVLNIEMTNEVKSIEIYNIQGQKVMSSTQKQVNVANLSSGIYMVRIQDMENNTATKKIVIQ